MAQLTGTDAPGASVPNCAGLLPPTATAFTLANTLYAGNCPLLTTVPLTEISLPTTAYEVTLTVTPNDGGVRSTKVAGTAKAYVSSSTSMSQLPVVCTLRTLAPFVELPTCSTLSIVEVL